MAEIKIEKKKPIWPWVILGLIILAVIIYFVMANDDEDELIEENNTEQVVTPMEDNEEVEPNTWKEDNLSGEESVSKYLTHIDDKEKMGIDHQYSNQALIYLINALENRAEEADINTEFEIQELKNNVSEIKEDPQDLSHANTINSVGRKIVSLMNKMQQEKFSDISEDVQQVETALQNIEPSTPTLDQKNAVNSFYKEAGDVLQKMKMS
ncbi:hypothetical protein DET49_12230 [Salegentibacter sp. 24]|uniref:hypothetical protein n=1 Tax=Salegentibacter sp. 24 TaxID=2183986 RepID=UPI0010600BAB|nr:hypothetical protein [Salegentibacter sp. 24]TDN83060.1 hypothetical protein DET49_12230 [Salegentibacter sp. 24]